MQKVAGVILTSALVFGGAFTASLPAAPASAIAQAQAAPHAAVTTVATADPADPESPNDPGVQAGTGTPASTEAPDGTESPADPGPTDDAETPESPEGPETPETPDPIVAPIVAPHIAGGSATVGIPAEALPGTWERDDLSFSFQWLVDGSDVPGATASRFVPRAADTGRALTVVVTAHTESGDALAAASAAVTVRPGTLSLGAVSVAGTARVGNALDAKLGAAAPAGSTLGYQWLRNGSPIAGATAARYTATAQDLGKKLSVTVRATGAGYEPTARTSGATQAVTAGTLASTKPSVTGTAAVGHTLTAKPGTWGPKPVKLSYQWLRNGSAISKATGTTYRLTAADAGKRISLRITGSLTGYTGVAQTSAQTGAVLRTLTGSPTPTIGGTVAVGKKLNANAGAWKPAPVALSYQWLRNGAAIKGATKSSYTLAGADAGTKVTVRVTGKKAGHLTVSKTSAAKSVPRVLKTAKPTISGTKQVGARLTVNRGTWTAGTKLSTQWLRNGAAIKGATGGSYTLTGSDAGKTIAVRVSGTQAGFTSATQTSASTAKITYPSRTKPSTSWECPAWAPIKGNASSMIYHVKGGASYTRTKPEECFSNAAAAQRAGYRAAKR